MSANVSFRTASVDCEALVIALRNNYDCKSCAICEKEDVIFFLFNHNSQIVHKKCYKSIKPAETKLMHIIEGLYKDTVQEQNKAYTRALRAVKIACGSKTLLSFLDKEGMKTLTDLFDKVGVAAALKIPAIL